MSGPAKGGAPALHSDRNQLATSSRSLVKRAIHHVVTFIVSILLLASCAAVSVTLMAPLTPMVLLPPTRRYYRKCMDALGAAWYTAAAGLFELVLGIRMVFYGTAPQGPKSGPAFCISNHRCAWDWAFLWCAFVRNGGVNTLKIVVKESLSKVPLLGPLLQNLGFVFLKRKWAVDCTLLVMAARAWRVASYPVNLLVFPEGTTMHKEAIDKSNAWATENHRPQFQHVLHPHIMGTFCLIQQVRGWVTALTDITIGYVGAVPTLEADFAFGRTPREVHILMEAVPLATIPDDASGATAWLQQRWELKESRLAAFYSAPRPSFDNIAMRIWEPEPTGTTAKMLLYIAAMLVHLGVLGWILSLHPKWGWTLVLVGVFRFLVTQSFGNISVHESVQIIGKSKKDD